MVEAKIRGAQDSPAITQNYETIVLKPHVVNGVNVISQQDVAGNNKKFVIKWGFTLTENLVFGVGCILDFDGGFFTNDEAHNYTITGNNTRVILNTDEAACLKGVYKGGTWLYPEFPLSPDEFTREDDVIVIGEEAVDTGNLKEKAVTDDKMSPGSVTRHAVSRNPENSIADNEDLTVNENGQLQLADKEYSPTDFSGLGRVYLRKNIVQRPNVASGSWITYAVDGITYLLYWYNNVLYNCHKIDNYGLVVVNHIAVESAEYDVEALPDYAQLNSLTYTESGGVITITLPDDTTITASSIYDVTLYPYEDNVDNINMLTQDMMSQAATIFVIQYDYELGEDITIPENCVLRFEGGSISGNGTGKDTITGQNTKIVSAPVGIFGSTLKFVGTFSTLKLEWFGIIDDNADNATLFDSLRQRIDFFNIQSFEFVSRITFSSNDIWLPRRIKLNGNNNTLVFTSTVGESCLVVTDQSILQNIEFLVNSDFEGCVLEHNTAKRDGMYTPSRVQLDHIMITGTYKQDHDYKVTAIKYICTNNHALGNDGLNYITGCHSSSLLIKFVKNGIDMKLDNVDVQGDAFAWMNDFNFVDTFIGCSGTALKIDNRDSSTQNPTISSGLASFNDFYIQPHVDNNTKLIMLYNARVNIRNLWPWDCRIVGELRNTSFINLTDFNNTGWLINQPPVTESGETYSVLSGFKVFGNSQVFNKDVFSPEIRWDTYDPASGSQITRVKGSEKDASIIQGRNAIPLSLHYNTARKTDLSLGSLYDAQMYVNILARDGHFSIHNIFNWSGGNVYGRIAYQYLGHKWDGTCKVLGGKRNTREFDIRVSSSNYTSNACNKVTYTPYIDSNKTTPLLSKLTFQAVASMWSTDENTAKIVKVEVSGNSIILYIETKQLTSTQVRCYFTLEFDDEINYTKFPTVADCSVEYEDELDYLPKASDTTIEIAYRTVASYVSKPATPPYVGFMYFSTDLSKPIYWTGDTTKGDNGWVDAAGNHPNQQ